MNLHITDIIKRPLLTEKSYRQMNDGVYLFEVAKQATKPEIKRAFELIFEVKVDRVNIINGQKKAKRVGRYSGFKPAIKKAYIKLAPGESLNLFSEEPETKKVKKTKKTNEE